MHTDPPTSDEPRVGAVVWRRRLLVAVVLAVPVLVFFAPSIVGGRAPGGFDLIYLGSPWRDATPQPDHVLSPVQVDQSEQIPWVDAAWRQVGDGRFPAWDATFSGGQAVGTNPIFMTWSVFTVAGAPFSAAIALVVRAVLAVYVAEVFLYWFLRRVGLGCGAAVFGAVAYAFSGTPVAFLTRNCLPFLLPVALLAADALGERRTGWRVVGVAATITAAWLEGFPAMFVHVMVAMAGWWAIRASLTEGWDPRQRQVRQGWIRATATFGLAVALGLAVSAASVVPFVTQIDANNVMEARGSRLTPLPVETIWWLFDDDALGDPQRGPWLGTMNPYEGLAAVGVLVMALALGFAFATVAARWWPRLRTWVDLSPDASRSARVTTVAMSCAAALVVALVYIGTPLLDVVARTPGFADNPFSRARFLADLALAVLAAVALDRVTRRTLAVEPGAAAPAPRWPSVTAAGALVAAVLWPTVVGGGEYLVIVRENTRALARSWGSDIALVVAGVVVCVAVRQWSRRPGSAVGVGAAAGFAFGAVAAAVAFLQVGLPTNNLTPQVDRAFYYPDTPGAATLASLTGGQHRFIGNSMGTYRLNSAAGLGVVDSRSHAFQDPQWRRLLNAVWGDTAGVDPLKVNADLRGATKWDSPVLDDLALSTFVLSSSDIPLGELTPIPTATSSTVATPGRPVQLRGPQGPFVGLDARIEGTSACTSGHVVVEVTGAGLREPARARRPARDAWGAAQSEATFLLAVPADAVTPGAPTRVTVSVEGADPACEIRVGATDGEAPPRLAAGPILRPGGSRWQLANAEDGWYYVRDDTPPLVRIVDSWHNHPDAATALAAAVDASRTRTDPLPVTNASDPRAGDGAGSSGRVLAWSYHPHGIDARVETDRDALAVAAFNSAPGWSVAVDGHPAALVEADGALLAVEVPAGRHDLAFTYTMPGLRLGVGVSALGLTGCALVVASGPLLRRRRARRRAMASGSA